MTASGEELRALLVEPASEMLQTVFLFFKNFEHAGEGQDRGQPRRVERGVTVARSD